MESSLWELACLERHYSSEVVASLARRIRQIAGATSADHLPDMKNQVELGKQVRACVCVKPPSYSPLP